MFYFCSWIFARKWPKVLQGPQLDALCGVLSLFAWIVVVSPIAILIGWGSWLILILDRDIIGLAVIMAGTALLLAFYSIMLWWRTQWQSSSMFIINSFWLSFATFFWWLIIVVAHSGSVWSIWCRNGKKAEHTWLINTYCECSWTSFLHSPLTKQELSLYFSFLVLPYSVRMNFVLSMLRLVRMHLSNILLLVSFSVYQQSRWQLTCCLSAAWSLMVKFTQSLHGFAVLNQHAIAVFSTLSFYSILCNSSKKIFHVD